MEHLKRNARARFKLCVNYLQKIDKTLDFTCFRVYAHLAQKMDLLCTIQFSYTFFVYILL